MPDSSNRRTAWYRQVVLPTRRGPRTSWNRRGSEAARQPASHAASGRSTGGAQDAGTAPVDFHGFCSASTCA